MPTRKIADLPKSLFCNDQDHEPPTMRVFEPGVYEHECPSCGRKTQFVVSRTEVLISDSVPAWPSLPPKRSRPCRCHWEEYGGWATADCPQHAT